MNVRLAILCLSLLAGVSGAAQAATPKVVEVTSAKGLKVWLIEDHKLPLISMQFAFRGGVETDPEDKQGIAVLTTSLLTQGAGPYDDQAFQQCLAAGSIEMDISAQRDFVQGEIKTLVRTKEEAFRLLALALNKPRFDEGAFERTKGQQTTALISQFSKPAWQGRYALFRTIFAGHPYSYRSLGSRESLARLTRDDVRTFARQRLTQDTLSISVVGAISGKELSLKLDEIFGGLPASAEPDSLKSADLSASPQTLLVRREGEQTNMFFSLPMMKREDPDWYAAEIANYILGGGGFVSRLMNAVRAKEGLTYGIGTGLSPMEKASILMGQVSTDNDKAGEVFALIHHVWQDFYDKGVTQEEVDAARDYLIGSVPLSLTSTDDVSGVLLSMQAQKLGRDYLETREQKLKKVKREDVTRVIQNWFNPARLSFALVGKPEGVTIDKTFDMITE